MKHNYTKGSMIGLSVAFMILPLTFMSLRTWAKIIAAIHGHLGQHQPLDADGNPLMDDPGLIFFEETKFALNMISIVGLGLIKSSILVMYKNIFDTRKFRAVVFIVLAYVIGWTISFTFSHLFTCYPITVFIEPYYGNSCVETVPMFLALLYTDVLADFVILVLPIPMVLSIKLDIKRKLAVIGMLMLGAAVCAVSVTRVIATYSIAEEYIKHPDDVIYYTAPVFFWTNIELSLAIIIYCTKANIPFLAQNGGVGWAKTFNLGSTGVLINLAGLNAVTIAVDKKTATIGGDASIGDTIAAADAAGALVLTGNCNCVGSLSAYLGGGYGNLMGEIGLGVDNIISLRVVTSSGSLLTIDKSSNPDLFWAFRGAGPNFGIVVSATVTALPATAQDRTAWINNLFFAPGKLPQIAQAIEDLPLTPEQRVYLVLTNSGPPENAPSVLVTGFLRKGTEQSGRAAFKALYDLGPESESGAVTPYTNWNDANIGFCTRGERKPAFSTTITAMKPDTWPEVWNMYKGFQAKGPNSAVLIERYNLTKAQSLPGGKVSFNPALREGAFAQAIVIPWYSDAALDDEALRFGRRIRDIWSDEGDATQNPTYANFAHGDESLEAIYGESLPRLRELKRKWDPEGIFGQWFAIT
ncbi:hypothetical protein E8E12_011767 [Didymella heteroderae]|uniref:FAD-binding PCMH-type domain-containing protein n=1 Tax=Didymella heteroderae TaxID=1769908 RepID=A0A9P4X0S4_9PLEO|nr:hypothetical protein E8E12_011767 [Didymella heteroderae]